MIHPAHADKLTPDEKNEIHNARILELANGEISGKEFVESLQMQCGFSEFEARSQWQAVKDAGMIAVEKLKPGARVWAPVHGMFHEGELISHYGSGVGITVQFKRDGVRAPFPLFAVRAKP